MCRLHMHSPYHDHCVVSLQYVTREAWGTPHSESVLLQRITADQSAENKSY